MLETGGLAKVLLKPPDFMGKGLFMRKLEIKLWGVGFIAAMFFVFSAVNPDVAYGFGGGPGHKGDHAQEEIGSTLRNNIIYFENDRAVAGVPLSVAGAPDDSTYQWTITSADGTENTFTTTEPSYTPVEADLEKLITVTVKGLKDAEAAIYYSLLPVVYINNETGYYSVGDEYSDAVISMQGNDAYDKEEKFYNGDIKIRLRGNSTKWREKKPFNIKLDTKADLLGMGKSKHWALLANDIEHTLMRNKLLCDFSGDIGMDIYSESENVIVIFNNQYYGVYQLCELVNIENERVDVYDWEESAEDAADAIVTGLTEEGTLTEKAAQAVKSDLEDAMCLDMSWITEPYTFSYDADQDGTPENYTITDYLKLPAATGGVLVEMDFYAFDNNNPSTMITEYSQPLYFKTPEYAITNPNLFDYTRKYIQTFEYALHSTDFIYHEEHQKYQAWNRHGGNADLGYQLEEEFKAPEYDGKHYSELFDLDSLVQNFLVCEFSMNWDSMKNSVFYYKDIDGLFHAGPVWDFDWAWGNINMYNIDTWYPTSWQTTEDNFTVEQYYQTVQWNRFLIRDPYFLVQVYEKYRDIRGTAIEDIVKEGGKIDTMESQLADAAAANDSKWSYTYHQYRSVGFEESLDNMREFISTRLAWMDEQFASLASFVASLGYYKPSNDLHVSKIDTESLEGFAEITAEVNGTDITYVTFQVNGTHQFTAEVTEGTAICQIPEDTLVTADDKWNVVEILAKNSSDEYFIESMEEGNYANAKSNYAVFYSNADVKNQSGATSQNETEGQAQDQVVKEINAQAESKPGSEPPVLIITVVLGMILIVAGAVAVTGNRKKNS
jgi:hypothetical protein